MWCVSRPYTLVTNKDFITVMSDQWFDYYYTHTHTYTHTYTHIHTHTYKILRIIEYMKP